ncbi:MAG: DUF1351 domain-containing protein [Eubacterium sp.]
MELKIFSPTDDTQVSSISWNYDELKTQLATKLEDYKGLVYTDEQILEAKKDKASLNKLRSAIEVKRKEVKARCLAPYNAFEAQVKEIVGMIDEPIGLIDKQIREYDEKETEKKKEDIKEAFESVGFGDYVTLEKVWNPRWFNKTYSLKQVKQDLHDIQMRIGNDIYTINSSLPDDLRDIAIQVYAKTLDLNASLAKAAEVKQLNEEVKRREEERRQREAAEPVRKADKFEEAQPTAEEPKEAPEATEKSMKRMKVVFEVTAEEPEFGFLNHFFAELKEHADFRIISKEDI